MSMQLPPYYIDEVKTCVSDYMRDLLITYSNIPEESLEKHLFAIRDKIWEVAPYPCVGYFGFLFANLRSIKEYHTILTRVKDGARFLDVGTCVGQELRSLVHDGTPSDNLYGIDITGAYWPLSFELFNDKATFKAAFIQSDLFDSTSELATKLKGSCDIICLGLILHLFSYDLQVEASCRIVELSKGAGSIIAGKSGGWDKAGVQKRALTIQNEGKNDKPERFRHDKGNFITMWEQVSKITDTEWTVDVETEIDPFTWRHQMDDLNGCQPKWVYFTMTRIR